MTKVVEILLERGGLLGVVVFALAWTALLLYRDLARERAAYQLAMQAAQAAAQKRQDDLLGELKVLHEKHKEDQRRATIAIQEVNDRATEAMQQLNDRVHNALDHVSALLEHTQGKQPPPQLPPPRAIRLAPTRPIGRSTPR